MTVRLFLVMVLSVSLSSVAETKVESHTSGYLLGTAKAEITPPPGFPTGGTVPLARSPAVRGAGFGPEHSL
jgi:hypothetical protein